MYERRVKIFLTIIGLAFLGMGGRLFHLQVFRGEECRREYEKLLRRTEFLPAQRGRIIDRKGRILAMDDPCHDLCLHYGLLVSDKRWVRRQERGIARQLKVDPERAREIFGQRAETTWRLAEAAAAEAGVTLYDTPAEKGAIDRIVRRVSYLRRRTGTNVREQGWAHVVVPALSDEQALRLRARLDQTVGMVIRPSHRRHYPHREAACHVIGLTGQVNELEQRRLNRLVDGQIDERRSGAPDAELDWLTRMQRYYLDGDTIGKRGVEGMCEEVLRGRRGYRRYQAAGDEQEESVEAVHGEDVHLTLDIALQIELTQLFYRLRAEQLRGATDPRAACTNGCIVVLQIPSRRPAAPGGRGAPAAAAPPQVLALVSLPTFDPNEYRRNFAALKRNEKDHPLLHRAVASLHPPGSTVKPIAALAGLGSGKITPGTTFHCTGYLFPEARDRFRCWIGPLGGAHGTLDLVEAIQHSCNIYFYHVGERLGVSELTDWFIRFGFGDVPGTGLPAERRGQLPSRGTRGVARMMAIGQGPIAISPLHLATAMVALARGGKFVSPMLALEGGPPRIRRDFAINRADAEVVQRGMHRVISERQGTAYKIFHGPGTEPLGFDLCGKTGTAESQPHRVGGQVVYEGDTAWFVGFAPYGNPQVAVAVMAEHAGPIARETFRICRRYGYIR